MSMHFFCFKKMAQSKQDLFTSLIVFVSAYAVASIFDINEQWMEIASEFESIELDEIPFGLAFLSMVFAWFTWRRWSEKEESEKLLRQQVDLTNEREQRLANAQIAALTKSKQLTILREMTEFLMLSDSASECLSVFSNYLFKMMPSVSGAIFLANSNAFSLQETWGEDRLESQSFLSHQCWAFRSGKTYDSSTGVCARPCSGQLVNQICLPVKISEHLRGIVALYRKDDFDTAMYKLYFSDREDLLNLLQPACDLLGIALTNIALREKLSDESNRDALTGLLNRKGFLQAATRTLQSATTSGQPLSFIMFDIDHFKRINDEYGHDIGDSVLVSFADIIIANTRAEDVFCRYGGEEFLLIMPGVSLEQAFQKGDELRQIVMQTSILVLNKREVALTVSGGVSGYMNEGETLGELIKKADIAMYEAKNAGRNTISKCT